MYDIDRLIFRLYIYSIKMYFSWIFSLRKMLIQCLWPGHTTPQMDRYFLYRYSRMMPYKLNIYIYVYYIFIEGTSY